MSAIKFRVFDARPYLTKGREPFPVIRERIDALRPGQGVTVVAPFMPAPLIETLKSEGFSVSLERWGDGAWAASFWRSEPL
jgi:uncharacterized protein (DUF2249 family)